MRDAVRRLEQNLRHRRDQRVPRLAAWGADIIATVGASLARGPAVGTLASAGSALAFEGRSQALTTVPEHGLNFVANLFGGTGLWMSMTIGSWRQ